MKLIGLCRLERDAELRIYASNLSREYAQA